MWQILEATPSESSETVTLSRLDHDVLKLSTEARLLPANFLKIEREEKRMANGVSKILMTGATGYIANQLLSTFREEYETVLIDVNEKNRQGEKVEGLRFPRSLGELSDLGGAGECRQCEGDENRS